MRDDLFSHTRRFAPFAGLKEAGTLSVVWDLTDRHKGHSAQMVPHAAVYKVDF